MGISEAQKRANAKYLSKQARINLTLTPDEKEVIQEAAARANKSITSYILDAVKAQITRDQDGEEIPNDVILSIIDWMKENGHTAKDIIDLVESFETSASDPEPLKQEPQKLNNKPLPPKDISKDNRTALTLWMLDHGYNDTEIMQYFNNL